MAEPMAMLGIGSSIIGGGISAIGAAQAGSAGAASYRYQSGIAALNAQIAEQNATYASVQGERTAMQYGMKARQQAGEIVAQQGASILSYRESMVPSTSLARRARTRG